MAMKSCEGRQLFGRMTIEESLLIGSHKRTDKAGVAASFAWVYDLFPFLATRRRQLAGNLSGGKQQMCAMARADDGAEVADDRRDEPWPCPRDRG